MTFVYLIFYPEKRKKNVPVVGIVVKINIYILEPKLM